MFIKKSSIEENRGKKNRQMRNVGKTLRKRNDDEQRA